MNRTKALAIELADIFDQALGTNCGFGWEAQAARDFMGSIGAPTGAHDWRTFLGLPASRSPTCCCVFLGTIEENVTSLYSHSRISTSVWSRPQATSSSTSPSTSGRSSGKKESSTMPVPSLPYAALPQLHAG